MHVFQPYPIASIELNPFTRFDQDWAALTAEADGKCNAMTVSWGGFGVIWGRNAVTVYVRDTRYTKTLLDESIHFSLTFFKPEFKSTLKFLGAVSGRDEDKLKEARVNINHYKDVPFIDEGDFVVICRKMAAVPIPESCFLDPLIKGDWYTDGEFKDNYHTMYIGEVLELLAR